MTPSVPCVKLQWATEKKKEKRKIRLENDRAITNPDLKAVSCARQEVGVHRTQVQLLPNKILSDGLLLLLSFFFAFSFEFGLVRVREG